MLDWKWEFTWTILPRLLEATGKTVLAAGGGFAVALVLGLVLTLAQRTRFRPLTVMTRELVELVRSTPLLLQVFFVYYVGPQFGLRLSPWTAGLLAIGLHYAAYLSEVYRGGIAAFESWCDREHGGAFAELDADVQDTALKALEAGDVPLDPALRDFFSLLLQNTKEGYFADPRHGGNHGMASWVHIGFPGARASFLEWTDPSKDNVPYPLGPVSIAGERA